MPRVGPGPDPSTPDPLRLARSHRLADGVRPVPEVTDAVRSAVTSAVEAYGLRVDEINIRVDDVTLGGPAVPSA